MSKLLFKAGAEWTHDLLDRIWEEIEIIAKEELRLTGDRAYYEPEIEIVTAKQMLDAYTSVGMPTFYRHWSFGKEFVKSEADYLNGKMGLAYEIVINSDPCIAYLMEENDALMQTLVMAHACVGHSAVFAHNYLFKQETNADMIVDYLNFAKRFIARCEERYGVEQVEAVIDACHALQQHAVHKYKRARRLNPAQEEKRALEKFEEKLADYDPVWEKVGKKLQQDRSQAPPKAEGDITLDEPQENLLYFIEKHAPDLPTWKRELIRIVRQIAEYFEPQTETQVVNEGYATFVHYYIVNRLYDKGLIDTGSLMSFLQNHTNVVYQHPYSKLNPYKLGFSILMDIKRICTAKPEELSDDDKKYGARLIGKDWVDATWDAMTNYRNESFILQFLTPKVARDLSLFAMEDNQDNLLYYYVTETTRGHSFEALREKLANQYQRDRFVPDIQVTAYDKKGSKTLHLEHFVKDGRPLFKDHAMHVVGYLGELWEYPVELKTIDDETGDQIIIKAS